LNIFFIDFFYFLLSFYIHLRKLARFLLAFCGDTLLRSCCWSALAPSSLAGQDHKSPPFI
jgi:hypothetical protein